MRDVAEYGRWRDLVVIFVVVVLALAAISAIRDERLLTTTVLAGVPLAALGCALWLAVVKRRYRP